MPRSRPLVLPRPPPQLHPPLCLSSVSLDLGLPWIIQGELSAASLAKADFQIRPRPQIPGSRSRRILPGATSLSTTNGRKERESCSEAPRGGVAPRPTARPSSLRTCHRPLGGDRDKRGKTRLPRKHPTAVLWPPSCCENLLYKKKNDASLSVFFINTLSWQPHAASLAVLGKVPGIRNPSLGLSLQPPHLANRPPGPSLHPSLSGSVTGPGVSASYASISVTEVKLVLPPRGAAGPCERGPHLHVHESPGLPKQVITNLDEMS